MSVIDTCVSVVASPETANSNPNFWNYDFIMSLKSDYTKDEYKIRAEELRVNVMHLLNDNSVELVGKLELVDALQRLGVGYQFEKEIKRIMKDAFFCTLEDDLYGKSLRFRLLRQHGYDIPADFFDKDDKSKLTSCSAGKDIKGVLSLYEASHLSVEGESNMDEAKAYTTEYLKNISPNSISPTLAKKVAHSLELPLHWRLPRVEARWYIDLYESEENMYPIVLEFAKLDFNMVQAEHQREFSSLARWWVNLDLHNLNMTRDIFPEHFFWPLGMISEPQYGWSRERLAKLVALVTLIDDIYDIYGSLEDLQLFTDAIERWDIDAMKQLPHYMKISYMTLYSVTNEIGYEILNKNGFDVISHLKKAWVILCNAYLVEAKWFHKGYTPTLEKYLKNAAISIGAPLMFIYCYTLDAEKITKEALECLEELPGLVCSTGMLVRLANDLGPPSNDEAETVDVPKSIQCYMLETGVSEEVGHEHLWYLVSETWKKMNKAKFVQYPFSQHVLSAAINLCRTAHCVYQNGDGHGIHKLFSDCLKSLLVEPINLSRKISNPFVLTCKN